MNDVLITPASRKVEFKDSSSNVDAKIETDSNGNLAITNAGVVSGCPDIQHSPESRKPCCMKTTG